jgi:hypothetical protein
VRREPSVSSSTSEGTVSNDSSKAEIKVDEDDARLQAILSRYEKQTGST